MVRRLKIGKLATKRRVRALASRASRTRSFERPFRQSEFVKLELTCSYGAS
jgi:hypothetical protein